MNLNVLPKKERQEILHAKINDLHLRGYSYSEIARFFSISKTTVFNAVKEKEKVKPKRVRTDANRECDRKYQREKRAKMKGYKTEEYRSWRKKNPEKYVAHMRLNAAVSSGKIKKKPCAVCKSTIRVHAHHPDYKKPLNVIWLCTKHHKEIHRNDRSTL